MERTHAAGGRARRWVCLVVVQLEYGSKIDSFDQSTRRNAARLANGDRHVSRRPWNGGDSRGREIVFRADQIRSVGRDRHVIVVWGRRTAGIDAHPPKNLRPARRQSIDDSGFAPDAVAPRAAPLWSVIRASGWGSEGEAESQYERKRAHGNCFRIGVGTRLGIILARVELGRSRPASELG